ncbi:hypothetical protein BZG01_13090 [Labilibaculum manganireducens]|uniref:Uncharacterized protein n=1 Tax=Labilibaculum manganireducens TaxID=1940525 RepID=A0A2N3I500_9BACT|nr:hypothetical protein BZG01_13090 [Labilibaculum manganireducens]
MNPLLAKGSRIKLLGAGVLVSKPIVTISLQKYEINLFLKSLFSIFLERNAIGRFDMQELRSFTFGN